MGYAKELHFLQSLEPFLKKVRQNHLLPKYGKTAFTQKTTEHDLLTALDARVERLVAKELTKFDSSIGVVGEELGGDRSADKYWLIDPIDGTIHFIRGIPLNTIMVCLIDKGLPVAGIIYNIVSGEFFLAAKGLGAYKGNQPMHVSSRSPTESIILTEVGKRAGGALSRLRNDFRTMDMMCAGLEFTMIAEGKVEGRVSLSPYGKDYDFAAGILICREAGAIIKASDGRDYSLSLGGDFIVANSETLYQTIVACLK